MNETSTKNDEEDKNQDIDEEEEEEDESIYMEIKKETPKIEYLDYKVYQKIINQLTSTNEIIKKMKEKSFQLSNNINDTNKDNKKSTETLNDIIEPKEELISKIKSENEQYKKEINSIKTKNSELEKNYEELKQKYEKEIKEKDDKIISMQKDIDDITKKYNELNEQMLQEKKIENKNLAIETILNEDKLVEKITNFLPIEDSLKIYTINKKMHFYYKYKNKYLELQKKYLESQSLLNEITSENIMAKYGIDDEELQNILSKYTNTHVISGNPMRYSIFHSLTFLETIVRKPMQEQMDEKQNEGNKEKTPGKTKGLFDEFFSSSKLDENKIANIIKKKKIKENLERKLIKMDFDLNYNELKKIDKEFKNKINKDELINIKFEFNSAEEIKNLMRFFLKVGLEEKYYIKFRQYLIDEFSELLFNCNSCLQCLKELEICNKIQGIRLSNNLYIIKQMTNEVSNLRSFNESNKKTKEKLLKQKNELEVKYNDSLIKNSSLNNIITENQKTIGELNEEKRKMEEEIQVLKQKVINDYKVIENKYNVVNNERGLLIKIFLDLKMFFTNKLEKLIVEK